MSESGFKWFGKIYVCINTSTLLSLGLESNTSNVEVKLTKLSRRHRYEWIAVSRCSHVYDSVVLSDSGRLHSRNAGVIHQTQLNKSNWTLNIWDMDIRPRWN